jgi:hypothetical protein
MKRLVYVGLGLAILLIGGVNLKKNSIQQQVIVENCCIPPVCDTDPQKPCP